MRTWTCKYVRDIEPFEEQLNTHRPHPDDVQVGTVITTESHNFSPLRLFLEVARLPNPIRVGISFLSPDPYSEEEPMTLYATTWSATTKLWVGRYTIEEGP